MVDPDDIAAFEVFKNGFGGTTYSDSKPLHHIRHPRPKRNCIKSLISHISVLLKRPRMGKDNLEVYYVFDATTRELFKKGFEGGYQLTEDEFWERFVKSEGHRPTKKKK
jgi:hypothetical protein